jgi:hypothetical protein
MISVLYRLRSSSLLPLFFLGVHGEVSAHDAPSGWKYPWACCSNMDCQQVQSSAVLERPQGYIIQSTGEVLGYRDKRIKDSPDGEYHWCAHQAGLDAGQTVCLFVPSKGS